MARIPMETFEEGTEIVRVYLAVALDEAQAAERVLADAGIDYAVEVEEIASRNVFGLRATRRGAGLWVEEAISHHAADVLERAGCVSGLVERDRGGV